MRTIAPAVLAFLMGGSALAIAQEVNSAAECAAMFNRADSNGNGVISKEEAAAMGLKVPEDANFDSFVAACGDE
jgi:hypothetical protein